MNAEATVERLRGSFAGPIESGSASDDDPLVLAHAASVADLAVALDVAVETGLPLSIRGGGHGQLRPPTGRLVVDTSHLADVQVSPSRRVVSCGPGARWSDVMTAVTPHGLAPLCGNSLAVGVAGYTLGGGAGWLSRQFGYTADNVVRAEVLLADGTPVVASADQESELFWGLRGAGANLALATRLDIRLVPVTTVTAGEITYPWDQAKDVLRAFDRQSPPDHLTATVILTRGDEAAKPGVAVQVVSTAPADPAREALDAVLPADGRPASDAVVPLPYVEAGTMGGTPTLAFELLDRLDDEVIDTLLRAAEASTTDARTRLEIRFWGGAPSRPDASSGPVGHRQVPFSVTADGGPDVVSAIKRLGTGRSFLNFLRDHTRTATAYTPADLARLRELKTAVDPADIFNSQHSISPPSSHRS